MAAGLAQHGDLELAFAGQALQFALDEGIELLDDENPVQPVEEVQGQPLA